MSLDISLFCECCGSTLFEKNITHNLALMAREAGLYSVMWRPEENYLERGKHLIETLVSGIARLKYDKNLKNFNPTNGYGSLELLLKTAEELLDACMKYPNAKIKTNR